MPAKKTEISSEDTEKLVAPIEVPTLEDVSTRSSYMVPQVFAAMVRAQAEIGNIAKDAKNPHFKNKFVSLEAASNAIIPILNKNGLFVSQGVVSLNGKPALDTTIYHEDGSSIGGYSYPLVSKDDNDPQKVAASMTYARRYSLMAIVGAAPEDDDGNLAATPPKTNNKDALKKHLMAIKADAAKFKELAAAAGVKAEKFDALTDQQAGQILAVADNQVPF